MKRDARQFISGWKSIIFGYCLAACLLASGCQSLVTPVANLQTPTPTPAAPKTGEADAADKLDFVQKGAFNFVYVFRRKDGAALETEDRKYLRAYAPTETNYWVVTDDRKTAIAGSNYQFPPESLDALKKRFNVEDLSKTKETQLDANANANG
jgi:hypothetical protein